MKIIKIASCLVLAFSSELSEAKNSKPLTNIAGIRFGTTAEEFRASKNCPNKRESDSLPPYLTEEISCEHLFVDGVECDTVEYRFKNHLFSEAICNPRRSEGLNFAKGAEFEKNRRTAIASMKAFVRDMSKKYGKPTVSRESYSYLDGSLIVQGNADSRFNIFYTDSTVHSTASTARCPPIDHALDNLEQQCRGMVEYGAISGSGNKVDSTQFCACLANKVGSDGKPDACGITKLSQSDLYHLTMERRIVATCWPAPH